MLLNDGLPKYDDLFNPLLKSLHALGGSGTVREIEEKTAEILKLSEKLLAIPHKKGSTEFSYRLAWARTYLRRYGLLENSSRGVWALTLTGNYATEVDKEKVKREVKALDKDLKDTDTSKVETTPQDIDLYEWKEELLDQVMKLSPSAFEKLTQRILRESGFVEVTVTGKSGDGGIDGKGIIKVGELISLPIIFQCKRYKNTVPSKEIRDFRGAMSGRAEKGLFITTGTFTRDAKAEATRDGVAIIDLVDGDQLTQLLKNLNLGVKVASKEIVEIDQEWFGSFIEK